MFSIILKETTEFWGQCIIAQEQELHVPQVLGQWVVWNGSIKKTMIGYAFEALDIPQVSLAVLKGDAAALVVYAGKWRVATGFSSRTMACSHPLDRGFKHEGTKGKKTGRTDTELGLVVQVSRPKLSEV